MGSAAVNWQSPLSEIVAGERHFQQWMEHPTSSIVHHEASCCEEARLWFLAYARSMEIGNVSQFEIRTPIWLQQLFSWGPSSWPISWCELIKSKVIDCGVFAALAREIFEVQGHQVHPAQALLSYNETCTHHWKALWKNSKAKGVFPWVGDQIVYHELCVLEMQDGSAKFYDSTFGGWYRAQPRLGFGALLALKSECPRLLRWGDRAIACGEWIEL